MKKRIVLLVLSAFVVALIAIGVTAQATRRPKQKEEMALPDMLYQRPGAEATRTVPESPEPRTALSEAEAGTVHTDVTAEATPPEKTLTYQGTEETERGEQIDVYIGEDNTEYRFKTNGELVSFVQNLKETDPLPPVKSSPKIRRSPWLGIISTPCTATA